MLVKWTSEPPLSVLLESVVRQKCDGEWLVGLGRREASKL